METGVLAALEINGMFTFFFVSKEQIMALKFCFFEIDDVLSLKSE